MERSWYIEPVEICPEIRVISPTARLPLTRTLLSDTNHIGKLVSSEGLGKIATGANFHCVHEIFGFAVFCHHDYAGLPSSPCDDLCSLHAIITTRESDFHQDYIRMQLCRPGEGFLCISC